MKNEYLTFSEIDFSLDTDFIDWVKKGKDNAAWESWMALHPECADKIAQARSLVSNIQFEEVSTSINKKQLWNSIQNEVQSSAQPKETSGIVRRLFIYSAAAASIALVLFFTLFQSKNIEINTLAAEQKETTLPDGSIATLNAESEITYDADWSQSRKLNLTGEAYFKVTKGNSFVVSTDLGTVEVLGTSFNVYARDKSFEVICTSGKVRVRTTNGDETILLPGDAVKRLENGQLSGKFKQVEDAIPWLEGNYKFTNEPLAVVIEKLERQFNIDIKIDPANAGLTFTGNFSTNNLEQALYSVFWPLKLEYNISGNVVTVQ